MSSKKKPTISTCEKCECTVLVKDFPRHVEICGSAPHYWEMSVVKPRCIMKGFVVQFDKSDGYLPPDTSGWLRRNSVLMHPQAMEILGIYPRHPVRVQTPFHEYIGVVWPCKELGILRLSLTEENAPWEKLASVTPIWNPLHIQQISVSVGPPLPVAAGSLQEYIQMYLTNSYIQPGIAIPLNYYGKIIQIVPDVPIELAMKDMSLEDGELESEPVFFVSSDCIVAISSAESAQQAVGPLSAFTSIGGMHIAKKTLMDFVLIPYLREKSCCSVLLWGLPGSGKTFLLSAVSKALRGSAFFCQSMDDFNEKYTLIPSRCVVILDWPTVDKEHKGFNKLVQLIDSQCAAVILSVRQVEDLDLGIRVRFPVEVEVDVPMEEERIEILRSLTKASDGVIIDLARRTHGFTGGDLQSLVLASRFSEGQNVGERLENARKRVRPTGIRQFILEVPHVSWDDIGGCEELKLEIQQAVIWPQKHRDAFERFGIDPPSGILLYGPPGCSKTLVARALASESKMNFLAVKGPELFSKWVGESEKAIRDLFSRARQVAPTIVFFDEIDAVGSSRGSEKSSGVSDRVLAQLLTELDGLEKQSGVLLLAATNRPDQLDSALLRPGRLDRAIYVGLPCPKTRRAIILMRTKRMTLAGDDIIEKLVNKTDGYSGAELVAVCRQAALLAMRENIEATEVRWKHFEETLTTIVPRTERFMLQTYEKFKRGNV
ncbi:Transitional endoplasmic reticulum ATPase [Trichostrongylus colubriformis]|uniref:Transitional endoplasmic reticulum ATPase n=1 Tax=Trichostrongylus colubriformis TaxID=6319 RepID=A0AAN8J185_TRICO